MMKKFETKRLKPINLSAVFLSLGAVFIPSVSFAGYLAVESSAQTYGIADEKFLESSSSAISVISSSNNGGAAISTAYANFGVLKISGVDSAIAGAENDASAISRSMAYWADQATIFSSGSTVNAFITANILLRGKLVAGNDDLGGGHASANWSFDAPDVSITGYSAVTSGHDIAIHQHGYTINSGGTWVDSLDDIFRLYTFQIPIRLGTAFGFSVRLDGSASGSAAHDSKNPGFGFANYDLGHSLYWAGISEVRDEGGNLITDYSLVSDSGVDYRNSLVPVASVPIPATIWLFLTGVLALGFSPRSRD